jgi:hypothetical protein
MTNIYYLNFADDEFVVNWNKSIGSIKSANNIKYDLQKMYNLSKKLFDGYIRKDWLWRCIASFSEFIVLNYDNEYITNVPFNNSEVIKLQEYIEKNNIPIDLDKNYILNGWDKIQTNLLYNEKENYDRSIIFKGE